MHQPSPTGFSPAAKLLRTASAGADSSRWPLSQPSNQGARAATITAAAAAANSYSPPRPSPVLHPNSADNPGDGTDGVSEASTLENNIAKELLDGNLLPDNSPPTPSLMRQKSAPATVHLGAMPAYAEAVTQLLHPEPKSSAFTMINLHAGVAGSTSDEQHTKKDVPMWTVEEDLLILQLVERYGKKWSKIASFLPGRTDNGVRNRWNRMEKAQSMRQTNGNDHGYRCRRCGQPKRGHICAALTSGEQPEGVALAEKAAELSALSASKMSAALDSHAISTSSATNHPAATAPSNVREEALPHAVEGSASPVPVSLATLATLRPTTLSPLRRKRAVAGGSSSRLARGPNADRAKASQLHEDYSIDDILSELNKSLATRSPARQAEGSFALRLHPVEHAAGLPAGQPRAKLAEISPPIAGEWDVFTPLEEESPRTSAARADALIESVFSSVMNDSTAAVSVVDSIAAAAVVGGSPAEPVEPGVLKHFSIDTALSSALPRLHVD